MKKWPRRQRPDILGGSFTQHGPLMVASLRVYMILRLRSVYEALLAMMAPALHWYDHVPALLLVFVSFAGELFYWFWLL